MCVTPVFYVYGHKDIIFRLYYYNEVFRIFQSLSPVVSTLFFLGKSPFPVDFPVDNQILFNYNNMAF